MSDDKLHMWINRDDAELQGGAALRPLLERLSASSFPAPVAFGSGREIAGFLDPRVLKAIDKRKTAEKLINPAGNLEVTLAQMPDRTALSLFVPLSAAPPAAELSGLFRDVIAIVSPSYARITALKAGRALHDEVYAMQPRSFYADGLYWLNFFGPQQEMRQGGAMLAENPLARVERLPQGLLIEVGDGPLDILTPEGRQRLIDATRALPPPRPLGT